MQYVYLVSNKLNGKQYVGITGNPQRRWTDHQRAARRGSKYLLHQAIAKYGVENFDFVIKHEVENRDDAIELEMRLIEELKTTVCGYNISAGGAAPILSEVGRANLSAALRRYYASPEARKKTGDAIRGKPKPKRKRIMPGQGRPQTEETKQKLRAYWANRRAVLTKPEDA